MGAQFTVLDSELAKPMGNVSGFWLTWYYFGYSAPYSNFLAVVQIGGAVLLCLRRTALAAAFMLLPMMLNIALIDIYVIRFPFQSAALRNALYVLAVLLTVVAFHARDLYRFFVATGAKLELFKAKAAGDSSATNVRRCRVPSPTPRVRVIGLPTSTIIGQRHLMAHGG